MYKTFTACMILLAVALPAPSSPPVEKIEAEGGLVIHLACGDGKLSQAVIRSDKGNTCRLRAGTPVEVKQGGQTVQTKTIEEGVIEFPTEKGKEYLVYAKTVKKANKAIDGVKKYDYRWESIKAHPIPKWFDDAKFGIFITWGPYSVLSYRKGDKGYAEHTPKLIYRDPGHYYGFLDKTFGAHPPEFGYKDVIPLFKAEKWNPDGWAELFHKAGAKYVVLTAEHHDGYALWDSDLTPWCTTKIGPKRDLVGDLGVAVRKKGMKYAPSYHRERHTGFFAQQKFAVKSTPHPDIVEEIKRMPEAAHLYGPFEISDEFIKDYVDRWKEIETKYQPDFMWIDAIPVFHKRWCKDYDHAQVHKFRDACLHMIADYLNTAEAWDKEVYLNNKGPQGAHNWPEGLGCREKDNLILDTIGPKWENPATLGTSYGYMKAEEKHDAYKSPTELIHLLCDVVSKNGNLLLNIGPKADGTIPEGMQERLLAMGKWLESNGEAIYGTQPWTVYGEGEGKPGRAKKHCVPIRPKEIRYTQKDRILYAMSMNKPAIPLVLTATKGYDQTNVRNITLLGSQQEVAWRVTNKGISIDGPTEMKGDHVWVFRIEKNANKELKASRQTARFSSNIRQ